MDKELNKLIEVYTAAREQLLDTIVNYKGVGTKVYANTIYKQVELKLQELAKAANDYSLSAVPKEYEKALLETYAYFKRNNLLMRPPAAFARIHHDTIYLLVREMQYNISDGIAQIGRQILRYVDTSRDEALRVSGLAATGEKLASGSTVRQMQKNLVGKLQEQGFMTVQYGSGGNAYQVSLDTYTAMVARSTTREAGNMARETQLKENGYDLMKMSVHFPTCEVCAPLQGRVYSISGKDKRFPPIERVYRNGYRNVHPNCRHVMTPFIEELQTDDEMQIEIAESNKPFVDPRPEVEKKLYNKEQQKNRRIRQDRYQYERYKARLGEDAPKSFRAFRQMKTANGVKWEELQEKYRYTGVIDRIVKNNPSAIVFEKGTPVPKEYFESAKSLTPKQKDGIYHYSNYDEGVRMNKYLGGVLGSPSLDSVELTNLNNTSEALDNLMLPYDTVVWRGTQPELLEGFNGLQKRPISEWKGEPLTTHGFTSTSVYKDVAYNKDVQMVILVPKGNRGAGYINEISFNKANGLPEEFEILLQKNQSIV